MLKLIINELKYKKYGVTSQKQDGLFNFDDFLLELFECFYYINASFSFVFAIIFFLIFYLHWSKKDEFCTIFVVFFSFPVRANKIVNHMKFDRFAYYVYILGKLALSFLLHVIGFWTLNSFHWVLIFESLQINISYKSYIFSGFFGLLEF